MGPIFKWPGGDFPARCWTRKHCNELLAEQIMNVLCNKLFKCGDFVLQQLGLPDRQMGHWHLALVIELSEAAFGSLRWLSWNLAAQHKLVSTAGGRAQGHCLLTVRRAHERKESSIHIMESVTLGVPWGEISRMINQTDQLLQSLCLHPWNSSQNNERSPAHDDFRHWTWRKKTELSVSAQLI